MRELVRILEVWEDELPDTLRNGPSIYLPDLAVLPLRNLSALARLLVKVDVPLWQPLLYQIFPLRADRSMRRICRKPRALFRPAVSTRSKKPAGIVFQYHRRACVTPAFLAAGPLSRTHRAVIDV